MSVHMLWIVSINGYMYIGMHMHIHGCVGIKGVLTQPIRKQYCKVKLALSTINLAFGSGWHMFTNNLQIKST